jgi:MFS family permease
MAAMGAGAVVGGLMVAHRSRPSIAMLSAIGLAFGVMLLLVAAAPTEVVALVALVFMGLCSIAFISTANATIQMQADPSMRGRVMALYAIAFLGSTPIGAPLVGWIADVTNPRIAIMVGGVATLAACVPLALRYWADRRSESILAVTSEVSDAEPGEVVDFAPRPIIEDVPSVEDQRQIRRVGTA